jgi:hypothetical protein
MLPHKCTTLMEGHLASAWILRIHSHDPWKTLCVGDVELGNTNLMIQGMTNNRMAPNVWTKMMVLIQGPWVCSQKI